MGNRCFPDNHFPGQDVSRTKPFPDNHFLGQDVFWKDVSRTSACPDSSIISHTRRFPDNHFPGKTFPGQFVQIIMNTLECSCSKVRRFAYATSQSHFNPTQSALYNFMRTVE